MCPPTPLASLAKAEYLKLVSPLASLAKTAGTGPQACNDLEFGTWPPTADSAITFTDSAESMQTAMEAVAGWWCAGEASSSGMVGVVAVKRRRTSLATVCWHISNGCFMVKGKNKCRVAVLRNDLSHTCCTPSRCDR
jgi:hypothetical protein